MLVECGLSQTTHDAIHTYALTQVPDGHSHTRQIYSFIHTSAVTRFMRDLNYIIGRSDDWPGLSTLQTTARDDRHSQSFLFCQLQTRLSSL